MKYYINDATGNIGQFGNLVISAPPGWSVPTQAQIDAYLLGVAKADKIKVLEGDLGAFEDAGCLYSGDTFDLTNSGSINLAVKRGLSGGAANKFKFCDVENVLIDFANQAAFDNFSEALSDEKDRIMVYYNSKKKEINDCANVAAVDAVTISFAV